MPNIAIIGDESHAGTYILRIRLKQDTTLRFGRFKKGKLISTPAGEYAYIGSALAEKGAPTLARRLVRHATRSGDQRPHRIREAMLCRFAECGLGDGNLLPQRGKTLHWNVDFLLDLPSAELVGISAIRSRKRLEDRLAKQLEGGFTYGGYRTRLRRERCTGQYPPIARQCNGGVVGIAPKPA